jgi:hypothetical protein
VWLDVQFPEKSEAFSKCSKWQFELIESITLGAFLQWTDGTDGTDVFTV